MVVLVICAVTAGHQSEKLLINADVVTLTEASQPAAVILAKIAATCTDFHASVAQFVALSEMGVDAELIVAMLATGTRRNDPGSREHRSPRGTRIVHEHPFGYPLTFRLLAHRQRTAHSNTHDRQRPGHQEANLEVHHANATNS